MGAQVIVTEVDSVKGLEAVMDGFQVMTGREAAAKGDFFVTVTGNCEVFREEHFRRMKDGAVICNSGHFDSELDLAALKRLSKRVKSARSDIEQYTLKNGRTINVLAEGRLVNLSCAEGHPPGVMDMSFANQALACEYIKKNGKKLDRKVYSVPRKIDLEIAKLKLKSLGVKLDVLTPTQVKYLASWEIGT